ncbi:MAG: hypothetical protein AAB386_02960 [Patescibacteria group bacterium]
MRKKSVTIKPTNLPRSSERVVSSPYTDKKVLFSFQRLQEKEQKFLFSNQEKEYFLKLIERMKSISGMTRQEMISQNTRALRCHNIEFSDSKVSESTFGVKGEDVDDDAWQFQISSNAHGRVHGYFIENVFYIVWLDPKHELYEV